MNIVEIISWIIIYDPTLQYKYSKNEIFKMLIKIYNETNTKKINIIKKKINKQNQYNIFVKNQMLITRMMYPMLSNNELIKKVRNIWNINKDKEVKMLC